MTVRIVLDVRRIKGFGIGTYIRNLVAGLAKLDRENHYLLIIRQADVHELDGLPPNFETVIYDRPDGGLREDVAFPMFLKNLRADLYHIPLNAVPLLMPKPYVVTVHDMSSLLFTDRSSLRTNYAHYRFRRGLLRADKVIAVSGATRRDVEALLNIPPERIRQIYNAPDPKFRAYRLSLGDSTDDPDVNQPEMRRVLERYQISHPFLLYAGPIRPQKNIPRLVEAFAVLRGDLENHPVYKDLRLIIIGDEISMNPAVRRAVIQTRVEHVVRFLGFVPFDTLRIFYEAASAFVFPSLYEGFGLPPLEAIATGTPVVASNVSSLPEVVGDAAVIINPENVFDIARGIKEVLLDLNLRRELRQKGYDQLKRFSWDQTARQVKDTYAEVLESRRKAW